MFFRPAFCVAKGDEGGSEVRNCLVFNPSASRQVVDGGLAGSLSQLDEVLSWNVKHDRFKSSSDRDRGSLFEAYQAYRTLRIPFQRRGRTIWKKIAMLNIHEIKDDEKCVIVRQDDRWIIFLVITR